MRRPVVPIWLLAVGLAGCLGEGDARCGPNQRLDSAGICACAPDHVLGSDRQCAPVDPPVEPAQDAGAEDSGAVVEDLDAGAADVGLSSTLGSSCAEHDDCGPDAPFCDTFYYDACLVPGCRLDPDDCPADWECCDLSVFGMEETLCVRAGECPTR